MRSVTGGAAPGAVLEGSLANLGLLPLIGFLCSVRKRGCVHLQRGGWTGDVCLEDGRIIAATFGHERGLSALDAILLVLAEANFTFAEGSSAVDTPGGLAVEVDQLASRPDGITAHQRGLAGTIPGPTAIPHVVPLDEASLDPAELVLRLGTLHTLLAIDGQRTVEQMSAHRASAQVLIDLAMLMELGLIHFAT